MPTDFDWIFMRDPYWRERPKEEQLAIPRSHPTDADETRRLLPPWPGVPGPPTDENSHEAHDRARPAAPRGIQRTAR